MITTILPGLFCAAELIAVWCQTHRVTDVLGDIPALDGAAALITLL